MTFSPGLEKGLRFLTVGHGTTSPGEFAGLLTAAGVRLLVDVRSVPGSRRVPQFNRPQLEVWLPDTGIDYRWEPRLGGFRRTKPDSANVALRLIADAAVLVHGAEDSVILLTVAK